jgi:hypothetical protein
VTGTIGGVDVVEVLRGTTAGPRLVAAGAVGGLAATATVVAVVAWWHGGSGQRSARVGAAGPEPRAAGVDGVDGVVLSLAVALASSAVEAGLLVADGAGAGDRWLVAVAVRLVLLATALAVHRDGRRHQRPVPRTARAGLGLLLLVAAALGAPATALSGRLWWAGAVVVVLLGAVELVWRILVTGERVAPATVVGALLLLFGVPFGVLSAPDAVPPHHQEQVIVDGVVLDLTFAPVRAGTNEAHLYAFDTRGRPLPVTDVHLAVVGVPGSSHPMFEVSPDHHLSYVLELPADPPWTVSLSLRGADERLRELTLHLDRP